MLFSLNIKQISLSALNCIIFFLICLVVSFLIGVINSYSKYITVFESDTIDRLNVKNKNYYLDFIMAFIAGIGIYFSVIKNNCQFILLHEAFASGTQ